MRDDQPYSAAAYVQCLAVWAVGGAIFILARMLASVIVGYASQDWFGGRWPFLYEGVFILLGVLFNVGWFVSARFSAALARFHFVGLNASVFLGVTLCISLFFAMSRSLYRSRGFTAVPDLVYPFVALIVVLTAAFILLAWVYYRADFSTTSAPGRFWFSFIALSFLVFLCLGLLVLSHRQNPDMGAGTLSTAVHVVGLGLGWIPLHACLLRFVWTPLTRKNVSKNGRL